MEKWKNGGVGGDFVAFGVKLRGHSGAYGCEEASKFIPDRTWLTWSKCRVPSSGREGSYLSLLLNFVRMVDAAIQSDIGHIFVSIIIAC